MKFLKRVITKILGGELDHPMILKYQLWRRKILGQDRRMKESYLDSTEHPKLHIGASDHLLDGWLNTDICPLKEVMFLDATKKYPFTDSSFAFVFSEHMIEHVSRPDGILMLEECFRILRPGGVLRIVTPNLETIMGIYAKELSSQQQDYLDWMSGAFTPDAPEASSAYVINAFFRLWGHQFIYDESTLIVALKAVGFSRIKRFSLGESSFDSLRGLENVERYPAGLLEFESICLEVTK
jgi:predicted SAM-dependent methyltransferase